MNLAEAIAAAGMIPPRRFAEGRWLRFPGIGKKRSNRSGWCRIISPTLAIYGDWSSNFRAVWRDAAHVDSEEERKRLREAERREQEFARAQRARQQQAAQEAKRILNGCRIASHPYLVSKGLPSWQGLVSEDGDLIVPARAVEDYRMLVTVQRISLDGTKRFLPGSRAKGAIHRLGDPRGARVLLCEGYATGVTLHQAASRLGGAHQIIVTFSAGNLVTVAEQFPNALVCADCDESGTGQEAARKTGLPWIVPPQEGDFNDLAQSLGICGLGVIAAMIREET